ncbi:MAG TPA: 3-oxoacyl-[acyl-carrier-protein] synthase III C-terminal domain-containing protein [Polyangiaceae bacterium]|nr:3-oxoacyl-[acyl-carrier-protein] synthase III C-terminal domain-containing protein [Polyangiaceae bacterium]
MTTNARRGLGYVSELVAASHAYPSDVVDNEEFLRRCRFALSASPAELVAETRMQTRRWCRAHENTASMTRAAVARLCEEHPELSSEIDAVVVASGTTMPMAHPSDPSNVAFADLSPLVLAQLGRNRALGLDLKACYCSGFIRGLQVADGLLANANYRSVLVVATEQGSRFSVAETNRSSFCFIVGDAAGAVVLRRSAPGPRVGIVDYVGYTDVEKLSWVGIGADAASIIMLGSRAGDATRQMLVECASELLTRNGLSERDVSWLIPIQTHAGLLDSVRSELGFEADKLLWVGDQRGFSGSASIPACLSEHLASGRVKKGDLVLSLAVGAGMNCGGALYYA